MANPHRLRTRALFEAIRRAGETQTYPIKLVFTSSIVVYGEPLPEHIDDDYVVDTGNIVAFTDGLEYTISKVGGYKSLFFSGEGLVCRFRGKGKVWIQTRTANAFVNWAHWYRPVQKSN